MRENTRNEDQLRPLSIVRNFLKDPAGSVLIETGETKVICTASIDESIPPFLKGMSQGWITAEYAMLPGSTTSRHQRERGRTSGRTFEIQRLIGRSLRSVVCLPDLGERTILIDCDVIQADGGTRTASITGASVALLDALFYLKEEGLVERLPLIDFLAAVSVGIVDGKYLLDLDYREDSGASVDLNVVMTGGGKFVEIQGTAEGKTFSHDELDMLLELSRKGIEKLISEQRNVLGPDAAKRIDDSIDYYGKA
ncbi:MAG: ribonuclease PH [Firmicutes bacterium]|nr:ribonuclease PH [Bacillota bacterium]